MPDLSLARTARRLARPVEDGPGDGPARPRLVHSRVRRPEAIALLLHGGDDEGLDPMRTYGVATWPLIPLTARIERWTHRRVAAYRLVNSTTGWNEPARSPLADLEWALVRIGELHPDLPVALVGHSMGGRVAFSFATDPRVTSVVGLAPWLADAFAGRDFARTPLFVVHGRQDTVTDNDAAADLVRRVKDAGGDATFLSVVGWHALLWRPAAWQRPVVRFLVRTLLGHDARPAGG